MSLPAAFQSTTTGQVRIMNDFPIVKATKKSIAKRKPVYGTGINDAWYKTAPKVNGKQVLCPFYQKWKDMLRRCYDPKRIEKYPTYIDCLVSDEWLTFSNFLTWMTKQDWENKHLDKDLLFPGNKIYSPKTCLFVSMEINMLLNDNAAKRGEWPIGVSLNKTTGKFKSECSINGRLKFLGYHDTPKEAHKAYVKFKENHVHQIALEQKDPLRTTLLNWKVPEQSC